MKVYEGQNIKGFPIIVCLYGVREQMKKVCSLTFMDLHYVGSFLKKFIRRPAPTCTISENPCLCRSMKVLSIKSLIGVNFIKKSPYRELTETRCIDLHKSSDVRERDVEHTLVTEAKKRGGIAPKFVSPGMSGMPDRLVLLPEAKMGFVELKAPGKKPRVLQEKRHRDLRNLGYRVYVLDRAEKVKEVLDDIQTS